MIRPSRCILGAPDALAGLVSYRVMYNICFEFKFQRELRFQFSPQFESEFQIKLQFELLQLGFGVELQLGFGG